MNIAERLKHIFSSEPPPPLTPNYVDFLEPYSGTKVEELLQPIFEDDDKEVQRLLRQALKAIEKEEELIESLPSENKQLVIRVALYGTTLCMVLRDILVSNPAFCAPMVPGLFALWGYSAVQEKRRIRNEITSMQDNLLDCLQVLGVPLDDPNLDLKSIQEYMLAFERQQRYSKKINKLRRQ